MAPICPSAPPVNVALLSPVADRPSQALAALIQVAVEGREGVYGVAVKHLTTGEYAAYNADRVYEAASLYKLNLMYGVYAGLGRTSLADWLVVNERAAYGYDDGEPSRRPGETIPVEEAVRCAITISDNTSAHVLLGYVPIWELNQYLARLGLTHTEILDGTRTTAGDMLRFLEMLATGRLVSPEASRQMLSLLLAQQVNDRLPLLLPEGVRVAHKTGNLPGLRHDVGIVYAPTGAYVVAVLVDGLPADEEAPDDPGARGIAALSREVFRYFSADRR